MDPTAGAHPVGHRLPEKSRLVDGAGKHLDDGPDGVPEVQGDPVGAPRDGRHSTATGFTGEPQAPTNGSGLACRRNS